MPKDCNKVKEGNFTNLETSLEYLMKKYKLDKNGLKDVINANSTKLFKNLGE